MPPRHLESCFSTKPINILHFFCILDTIVGFFVFVHTFLGRQFVKLLKLTVAWISFSWRKGGGTKAVCARVCVCVCVCVCVLGVLDSSSPYKFNARYITVCVTCDNDIAYTLILS